MRVAAQEGRLTQKEANDLKMELTKQLQDLSNQSAVEQYAYFKNSPFADDFSNFNDFQRQLRGTEKTLGEYTESYIDKYIGVQTSAINAAANAATSGL